MPYSSAGRALRGAAPLALTALLVVSGGPTLLLSASGRIPPASQSWGEGKVFKPKFEDLVRRADLIVTGRVIQVGRITRPGPSKSRPKSKRYAFWEDSFAVIQIDRVIKGKAGRGTVKVAFHSDLEGDHTKYQAGKNYLAFLLNPSKYPDAHTTAHYHYGEYLINERGKAERVADPSEISKPASEVIQSIHKVLGPKGRGL